jgi:peptide/nickel transport system permease protein
VTVDIKKRKNVFQQLGIIKGKLFRRNRGTTYDQLSQFQLMKIRFSRHKIAVVSCFFLVGLYLIAFFAPFFAPYDKMHQNLDYAYAPPSHIGFSLSKGGFYAKGMIKMVDPVILSNYYVSAPENDTPLGLFVKGDKYKLFGLFETNLHFFGADLSKIKNYNPEKDHNRYVFFLTGTDQFGYDIFSRIIYGARISLSVGLVGVFISFLLGIIIGGISGYCPGKIDTLIQRFMEILNSIPSLPLWMALGAAVPRDWTVLQRYFAIIIVLSFIGWTGLARVVRGKILSLREEDYAVGARLLGAGNGRILFRHLMPGFTSHIIVALTTRVPTVILGETSLSFIGLGLTAPVISWGVMLQECMNIKSVISYPWLLAPVIILFLTVLAFNFMGDGLRDAADPYSSK